MEPQFDRSFALELSHLKTVPVFIGFLGGHKFNSHEETIIQAGHSHTEAVSLNNSAMIREHRWEVYDGMYPRSLPNKVSRFQGSRFNVQLP